MTTLLWNRPTKFDVKKSGQRPLSQYRWTPEIKVEERKVYRLVVDGSPEAIEKLLAMDSITPADFPFRPLRKPVRMLFHGMEYNLYSLKKGGPR